MKDQGIGLIEVIVCMYRKQWWTADDETLYTLRSPRGRRRRRVVDMMMMMMDDMATYPTYAYMYLP